MRRIDSIGVSGTMPANGCVRAVRSTLLALCLLSPVGIASDAQAGREPERDPKADAVLKSDLDFYFIQGRSVRILAVDGRNVRGHLHIAPGSHIVAIGFSSFNLGGSWWSVSPCLVALEAKSGHTYRAEADDSNLAAWSCSLKDETSGERTEGVFNPPEPTLYGAE